MEFNVNYKIPFNKPCLEGDEISNIITTISNGKIAGDGHFNTLCHNEFKKEFNAPKVLLTASCTDALELSGLLIGLKPGDEFILPSFTFVSTASSLCLRGALPVFIDIRPDTFNIDESMIENAITERTKAIVPVHYAGISCDMNKINAIAKKYNLDVIEDAAQGFLAKSDNKYLGTFGRVGCFSFHETKTFISGEGGCIVVNNEKDVEQVEILRDKGTNRSAFFRGEVDKYTWVGLGSSFLPSDMIGAFLYGQWCSREQILMSRKKIYDTYMEFLSPLINRGLITTPKIPNNCSINYHMFNFLVESDTIQRNLLKYLQGNGIAAVRHYVPLHSSPFARSLGIDCHLPITDSVAERLIRLPFFNSLSIEDQKIIAKSLFNFFRI